MDKWNSLPSTLQGGAHVGLLGGQQLGLDQIRCQQRGRAEAPRQPGRGAAAVLAGGDGRLLQGRQELYAELNQKNPAFKKVYDSYKAFMDDGYLWHQVADYTMDSYMIRYRNQKT